MFFKDGAGLLQRLETVKSGDGELFLPGDYNTELSLGNVPGRGFIDKFGFNKDVDTVKETIWSTGGRWQLLTTAEEFEVLSDDSSDTAAGTGARTVRVHTIDANGDEQTRDATLNGTTPVLLGGTDLFASRAYILTAGSQNTNEGTITVRPSITTSSVRIEIPAEYGQSQAAIYRVPNSKKLVLKQIRVDCTRDGTDPRIEVQGVVHSSTGLYRIIFENAIDVTENKSFFEIDFNYLTPIEAGYTFELIAASSVNNSTLYGRLWGELVDV